MTPPSYRRRSDGVCEIVRPTWWQRVGPDARVLLIVMGVAAGAIVGAALYASLGPPFLIVAAGAITVAWLWRIGRPSCGAPTAGSPEERKTAP